MNDRRHEKPIGETGRIRAAHSRGEPIVTWEPIQFPAEKREQELVIASAFANQLSLNDGVNWTADQLHENDFDFHLHSNTESRYLELLELVIPSPKRGKPYASREQVIQSKKFAATIIDKIRKKSIKYPVTMARELDLLVYVTHWRFWTSEMVRQIVAHHLTQDTHPFARVLEFSIFDEQSGVIQVLFPNDNLVRRFNPLSAVAHRYVNFDPAKRQPIKNQDGSVGVGFYLSRETVKKFLGSNPNPLADLTPPTNRAQGQVNEIVMDR